MSLYSQLEEYQLGNVQSKEDVYFRFCPIIRNYSKKLYYEEGETDLKIAFLELIKKIDLVKFEDNDKQIAKYICVYLQRKSIDLYRQHKRDKQDILGINYDFIQTNALDFTSNLFIKDLLSNLTEMQRNIMEYKFLYKYSDIEIAEMLCISRQAVNRCKNRAIRKLKKIIKEWGDDIGRKDTRNSFN